MSSGPVTNVKDLQRRPVSPSGGALLFMCYQTLGVIYSDIGTSPLYVLNGIWPSSGPLPSNEDIIGGLSAIIWSLTILPLIKYTLISLRFGTEEGEGGTFALCQGLYPRPEAEDDDRTLTSDSGITKSWRQTARGRHFLARFKWPLYFWSLFGTALTLSDGIFTPAVSVTSAVGGLAVAKPSVINKITPISIGFLAALFVIQRFGTARITAVFAPVTFGWLALLAVTGVVNIAKYPGIFRAVDPSRAVMWFVRTKQYDQLAGVLLAITGCEAMFANLGQFNALSIQLSFGCFVYPSLVLAYLGQGSRLIVDKENVFSNVFYQTIPGGHNGPLYWIVYVFSILATLIASQALITATFSLSQQLINMKSLPPLRLVYTSSLVQGQIYVPTANIILVLATVIVVGVFKNLGNMTNAYGFAVATVMIVTTSFIAIQLYCLKQQPIALSILFFLVFGFFDGLFWGASLRKVPHGAWVPLTIGFLLTALMMFWTWAKGLEDDFDGKNRRNPRHFIINQSLRQTIAPITAPEEKDLSENSDEDYPTEVVTTFETPGNEDGGGLRFLNHTTQTEIDLARIPACAIFHKLTAGRGVPHSFYAFIQHLPALPRIVVFLSVRVVPIAYVNREDAYNVTKVRSIPGFYGVLYRTGFRG
ncbi:hypothetical protein BS47DRAFT_1436128 [Hydnum rufescens UP504]|uniref:Potassium transporter n=1 Tax=Hydnum rufescens UP504 TaxID=1448309 RepID=A0A9P6DX61_9AGAM|nr:hypothetical protein BS47DRAFT_1436128 [Hydnum rufescens UP504]